MKNEEELISVIIPVYNVKSYLRKCADSVFAQTFRNLEIILIDDGSTDGSGELCDQLAKEDARVRVIHKENRGPAEARNVGIRASTGDYLYFLDSDDAISAVTLNHLWTACIRTKADVAFGDFIRFSEEEIPGERRTFTVQPVETKEMIRRMLLNQGVGHQAWGKLYRRSFLNDHNVRFREGLHREEDIGFNLTALAHCTHAKECPYPLYHYRRSLDTQSHTYRPNIRRETDETLAWYREIIAEHYPDDPRMDELYRFRELWGTLYNIALGCGHADNPKPYRERKQDFEDLFTSETLDANKALDPQMNKRLDPLHKILATLARKKNFRAIWLLGKLEPLTYKLKIR